MSQPVQDAPAVLKIAQNGTVLLSIPDADGAEIEYLMEPAPRGFSEWAVKLTRLDAKDGPYRVERVGPGIWTCTCRWTRFKAKFGRCKHRVAVRCIHKLIERLTSHDREDPKEA